MIREQPGMSESRPPRMTMATLLVLNAMLSTPGDTYGLKLCNATGLDSGTLYPILRRLEGMGWLESHWESIETPTEGRPARHYYRWAEGGEAKAREALSRTRKKLQTIGPASTTEETGPHA